MLIVFCVRVRYSLPPGIFSIVELGLIGDILETFPYHRGKVGYMLFVSVWTSISLLLHWTFPFLFAAVWAALTTLLWFIAAGYTTTDSCTVIAPGPEFGNKVRVCSRESDKWKAMTALGWIKYALFEFSERKSTG